jgi:hypothetical protein
MMGSFRALAAVGLTLCAGAGVRAQQPVPQTYVLTDIVANIWAGGPWINDSGQIACLGTNAAGQERVVLLTPR